MPRRRRRGVARRSWRDMTKRERALYSNAAAEFYAAGYGKQVKPEHLVDVPPERAPRAKPVLREAKILRDILVALRRDPRVAMCWRQNAGTFGERYIKLGPTGMPDVVGILAPEDPPIYGGFAGRFFAIEVKAPGKKPEPHQAEMIERLRSFGCVAGVAHSVEEALGLLP